LIFAQEAYETSSLLDLTRETNDLKTVFLNQTCLPALSLPDASIISNQSNITLSQIKLTAKSFDISNQSVELDALNSLVGFSGNNASMSVAFSYYWTTPNATLSGVIVGQLALVNISNLKTISLTNSKIRFLTNSLGIQTLNFKVDSSKDQALQNACIQYYQSKADVILNVLTANMTNCLNNWLYPMQAQNFYSPYQYTYQGKSVNYTYQLTGMNFGKNFLGFWYDTKISNFSKSKTIKYSTTSVLKYLKDSSSQSFMSKSIFMNTIGYALDQSMFDLNMTEYEYPSSHFDYFIGELALFIPEIRKVFYADERVSGFCKVSAPANSTFDVQIKNYNFYLLNFFFQLLENIGIYVSLPYFCRIQERNTDANIFNFSIHLNFTLKANINNRVLDFSIDNVNVVENSMTVQQREEFPHTKQYLIDYHMKSFLQEMLQSKTFGSNFPVKGDTIAIAKDGIVITALNQFN